MKHKPSHGIEKGWEGTLVAAPVEVGMKYKDVCFCWLNQQVFNETCGFGLFCSTVFHFSQLKKKKTFWGARGFAKFFKKQGGRVRQAGLEVTLRPHSLRSVWVSYLWTRTRRHEKFMAQIFQIFKDCPATARSLSKHTFLMKAPAFGKVAEFGCWRCILYTQIMLVTGWGIQLEISTSSERASWLQMWMMSIECNPEQDSTNTPDPSVVVYS